MVKSFWMGVVLSRHSEIFFLEDDSGESQGGLCLRQPGGSLGAKRNCGSLYLRSWRYWRGIKKIKMKTSRFIGYSLPGHILCRLLRYQSCYNRLRCLYPNIENGELCSVYGSVGALAVWGNNSMLCLAMMYEEVFSWEPFRKRDRSIAFLSRIIYNKRDKGGDAHGIRLCETDSKPHWYGS